MSTLFTNYSWGNLTASPTITYSSGTATQAVTSSIFSGSSDNQVLGVQQVVSGTCPSLTATAFNLNTTGSIAPAADISTAKLYYTAKTNAFSTATLFGSVSNPSGAFTITAARR